ncbi:hypothetical protein V1509DRAFT_636450 [Lipomyces kononenkoae]
MPIINGKFYCPLQCSGGRHRNARYVAGLELRVSSRTYYRHRNQRRLIGRASLLTGGTDEEPPLIQGPLETAVGGTTNPGTPFDGVDFGPQERQNVQEFDDVQQSDNVRDDQNIDDEEDEAYQDSVADHEETSDGRSVLSVSDLSEGGEVDILDWDSEKRGNTDDGTLVVPFAPYNANSSVPAGQPSSSGFISGTYTTGRSTIRRLSLIDTESIRWLLFKVMHGLDKVGFRLLGLIPNIATQSLHKCRELINDCTGLRPIRYDCCHVTPCVCYFAEYTKAIKNARSVVLNALRAIRTNLTRHSRIFHSNQEFAQFLVRRSCLNWFRNIH